MLELETVIRFTSPSLGNRYDSADNVFRFQRSAQFPDRIIFMSSWHAANMRFASQVCGMHHKDVGDIFWDMTVIANVDPLRWFRCYGHQQKAGQRRRWSSHEFLGEGEEVKIRCVVPVSVSTEDFTELLRVAGKYRGLSPWRPREYGRFDVARVGPIREAEKKEAT